jgi:schlafen family protein
MNSLSDQRCRGEPFFWAFFHFAHLALCAAAILLRTDSYIVRVLRAAIETTLRTLAGIEDDGKVRGIKLDTAQEKDRLSQRIHQVVRHRIKPSPLIQVDFVDVRGSLVCRISVLRGEEQLYFLDGVIYVRDGPTYIKAQPEIVKRLLAAHAF